MEKAKSTKHMDHLLNYSELSLVLTGNTTEIRRENIPRKHIKAITQLNRYLVRWVNKNKKFQDGIPRVEVTLANNKRVLVKVPKKVPSYSVIKNLPSNAEMLEKNLFQGEEGKFYTTILDIKEGLEILEWYNLEDAKNYLQNK